jgi:hypothetical protein
MRLEDPAASRNTWSGLLVLSISRPGKKNQVRPEVVLVNSHDKSSAYQLHCDLFRLVYTNGTVVSDADQATTQDIHPMTRRVQVSAHRKHHVAKIHHGDKLEGKEGQVR